MTDLKSLINKPKIESKEGKSFIDLDIQKDYPAVKNEPEELLNDLSFADSDFDFAETLTVDMPSQTVINKTPKDALIELLKTAELDIPYIIQYNGDFNSAETYIHRMRVELSRFRAKIIKLNKPLDHFHILKKSIVVESDNFCTITLLKTYNRKKSNVSKEIDDVLDFLTVKE